MGRHDGLHMNSSVTDADKAAMNAEPAGAEATVASAPQDGSPQAAPAENAQAPADKADGAPRRKRGGRRHNKKARAANGADAAPGAATAAQPQDKSAAPQRRQNPALQQLQALYPQLFGEQPKPLKRGIFQDLEAAQPGVFAPADLKLALGIHTRSTRYLNAVAQGMPRHDLDGQVVEQMAPEHVFHALVEVFRRRKPRDGEDMTQKLRRRMAMAFEASGMAREDYLQLVRGRDDATNALLDEAMAEVAGNHARDEALLRAFEASGAATVDAFADMYGMQARHVGQQLERARRVRAASAG